MKLLFVRHSEPDYSMLDGKSAYTGFGRGLAPLSKNGRAIAARMAKDNRLSQAQVIISSSVTRALETAIYIVCETDLPLLVESFFHEWRPDVTGKNASRDEAVQASQLYKACNGEVSVAFPFRYETAHEMKDRFLAALEQYRHYDCAIIVCHGMLMRLFTPLEIIDYGQIIEVEL